MINLKSVLSRSVVAQPLTPAVSETYLIPTAATGPDWAGKDGSVGIYTAGGWRFASIGIGEFLYVKDENAFYYRNASGVWTAGVGSIVLGPGSVSLPNILGAKASFVIKAENQTTNAPPLSPTAPTAYIIGSSPTGTWSGNAGKLAICLVNGAFTIITPAVGDQVYDKARSTMFQFNGTAWVSAVGILVDTKSVPYAAPTAITGIYSASSAIPSIASGTEIISTPFTMKSTTNKLRLRFSGMVSATNNPTMAIVAFFLNSNANAIKAAATVLATAADLANMIVEHEFVPGTTSPITISVRAGSNTAGSIYFNALQTTALFSGAAGSVLTLDEIVSA